MAFPWTLQGYIAREMGKTFALTALALTGVLGLGGGVLQMVKLGGELTPMQMLRLMWLILPVAGALTLPMAALFSTAVTYGRLSADNELVACRAGGININRLLLPTLLLGLFCATVTFAFTNFVIPRLVRDLNQLVGGDYGSLMRSRLNRPRGMTIGKYSVRADDCVVDANDPNHVALRRFVFVEAEGQEWVRFGTAKEVHLQFQPEEFRTRLVGEMQNLSLYDPKAGRFERADSLPVSVEDVKNLFPMEIKFLTLRELFYFLKHPTEWRDVRDALARLRREVLGRLVIGALEDQWQSNQQMMLKSTDSEFILRTPTPPRARPQGLDLVDVTLNQKSQGKNQTIAAARGAVEFVSAVGLGDGGVQIDLYDAKLTDGKTRVEKDRVTLGPFPVSAGVSDRVANMSEDELLGPIPELQSDESFGQRQAKAMEIFGGTVRRLRATMHERACFSLSILVLVILGAAMAIILRGAHVLTAFGISFIPSVLVLVGILMGKQMTQNAATHLPGLGVLWSGMVLVALIDGWILTRLMRR